MVLWASRVWYNLPMLRVRDIILKLCGSISGSSGAFLIKIILLRPQLSGAIPSSLTLVKAVANDLCIDGIFTRYSYTSSSCPGAEVLSFLWRAALMSFGV